MWVHTTTWGHNLTLNITLLWRNNDMIIYAYICSMVKDRMVALHHPKLCAWRARPAMARGYGAGVALAVRWRAASGPQTSPYRPLIGLLWRCVSHVYYFVGAWAHVSDVHSGHSQFTCTHVDTCGTCIMTCYMVHYIVHICLTTGVLYNYLDIQCMIVTHVMLSCSL